MAEQCLILVVGHNASGKTMLSNKIIKHFNINRVNGDDVRDFLISKIRYYSDMNYSYPNPKIRSANKVVTIFRKELIRELLSQGESVLVDGGGITKESRKKYMELKKISSQKMITVIIESDIEENMLLQRLKHRDKSNRNHRWVDLYDDIRKGKYEGVTNDEADHVLKFNQDNSDAILKRMRDIVNK